MARRPQRSPLAAVVHGLLAGAIGNAVFTAYQAMLQKVNGEVEQPPTDWSEAPAPAQVGQRVVEGVFETEVPLEQVETLTNAVHWIYGTSWGAVYGILEESIQQPVASGVALTTAVMAADYSLLPAMGLYKQPWQYPATTLGKDFANHLVYGFAVAGAYRALDRVVGGRG